MLDVYNQLCRLPVPCLVLTNSLHLFPMFLTFWMLYCVLAHATTNPQCPQCVHPLEMKSKACPAPSLQVPFMVWLLAHFIWLLLPVDYCCFGVPSFSD